MQVAGGEKNKGLRKQLTSEKLTEMLKEIDISAVKESEGKYSARAGLTALFDHGTFSETGKYVAGSSDPETAESVICGYGAVNGELVFAFAQDRSRQNGAFDEYSEKKIVALYDMALKNGAPIVGIFDSDGIAVYEGVRALASLGRTLSAACASGGVVPRIAIVPGVCGGTMGVWASTFDFVLTVDGDGEHKSELYAVSPFVSGGKNIRAESGASCLGCASADEAFAAARRLLSFLPSNRAEGTPVGEGDLDRAADIAGLTGEELVAQLADGNGKEFIRLWGEYAPEMVAGFARIGGVSCAVIANDSRVGEGALTVRACKAAAEIQSFAGRFGMPLISLADSSGLDRNEKDSAAYISAARDMVTSLVLYDNAKIGAVVGNAYGAGFMYMGSKALGADVAFALPDARIGALSPETSVAFLWNDRVREDDIFSTREMLEREWSEKILSPAEAAVAGEIDDIVSPAELRARIVSALYMLLGKSRVCSAERVKGGKR